MKSSTLLICLGWLLSMSTTRWSRSIYRRTLPQIYQEAKSGGFKSSAYQKVVTLISFLLIFTGVYWALTGR